MSYQTNFKNTIWAGGALNPYQHADVTEHAAGVELKPGQIARIDSSGDAQLSFGASVFEPVYVVLEKGSHVDSQVEDVIAVGENAYLAFPRSGEMFNGLVIAANATEEGQAFVKSNGFFQPQGLNDGSEQMLFVCQETTSASADDRLVLFKKL